MLIPRLPSEAEDTGGSRRAALQDRCLGMELMVLCVRRAYVHVFRLLTANVAAVSWYSWCWRGGCGR